MRSIASIGASVIVAVLLAAALLAADAYGGRLGVSFGGALVAATLAAFLLTYDVLKRDGLGFPARSNEGGGPRGLKPVRPRFEREDSIGIDAVARGGTEHMNRALSDIKGDTVYVLTLILGPRANYEHDALIEQLAVLARRVPRSAYVYLLGRDGEFIWFAHPESLKRHLEHPADGRTLLGLINTGHNGEFDQFDGLVTLRIPRGSSNVSVLRQLAIKGRTEAMIVHEQRATPIGPIDWTTLVMLVTPAEMRSNIGPLR